jgi:hypothetical protein
MTNTLRHQIIGFFTLLCFGIYLCVIFTGDVDRWHRTGEATLRLSILLGVIWLAWDDLLNLPRWFYIFAPIIILAMFVFPPKIVLIVVFILAALWFVLKFIKFIFQPLPPRHGGPKLK